MAPPCGRHAQHEPDHVEEQDERNEAAGGVGPRRDAHEHAAEDVRERALRPRGRVATQPEEAEHAAQDQRHGDDADAVAAELHVPEAHGQHERGERGHATPVLAQHHAQGDVGGGDGQRAGQRRRQPQRVDVEPEKRAQRRLPVGVEHLATAVGREEEREVARQHLLGVDGVERLVKLKTGRQIAQLVKTERGRHDRHCRQNDPVNPFPHGVGQSVFLDVMGDREIGRLGD